MINRILALLILTGTFAVPWPIQPTIVLCAAAVCLCITAKPAN